MTECTRSVAVVEGYAKRVEVKFDAPRTSSDGGVVLLRELDRRLGLSTALGGLVPDHRDPGRIDHSRSEQLLQRVLFIAHGYEDCNDADHLRTDPAFRLACRSDLAEGPLSSQPTLSRFENCVTPRAIAKMLRWFERSWVDSLPADTDLVILDVDSTDDRTYGDQQLTMFNGYYDHYVYHPLLVFDGLTGQLVTGILRPGNVQSAKGVAGPLRRLITMIRGRFPTVPIVIRGDSAFSMPRLMAMLEVLNAQFGNVEFVFGMAQKSVLMKFGAAQIAEAAAEHGRTKAPVKLYSDFEYAAGSWLMDRRIVLKAEHNAQGSNPRFVVTTVRDGSPEEIYRWYCDRGQAENDIKNLKNAMIADRLSCHRYIANFFRLILHMAAYRLMFGLHRELQELAAAPEADPDAATPGAAELSRFQFDTLRLRLLKVAALVTQSVRRVLFRLPESFPMADLFAVLLRRLSPPLA